MKNFTFFDFQELTNSEKKLSQLLHSKNKLENKENQIKPTKAGIANILAYSKALSVRNSETVGHIENVLN